MIKVIEENRPICGVISSGDKNRMYTLRIIYHGHIIDNNGIKTPTTIPVYSCNLSTNYKKALVKAGDILSQKNLPMRTAAEFGLEDIHRSPKGNKAEMKRQIIAQRERERIEREEKEHAEIVQHIHNGLFLSGMYVGQHVKDVAKTDISYIKYMANSTGQSFNEKIHREMSVEYLAANPIASSEWLGKLNSDTELTLTYVSSTPINGIYGVTWLLRFLNEGHNMVTTFTTAKKLLALVAGDEIKATCLIKKHEVFNNDNVTQVKIKKIL